MASISENNSISNLNRQHKTHTPAQMVDFVVRVKTTYGDVKQGLSATKRAQRRRSTSEGIPVPTVVEKTRDDTFTGTAMYPDNERYSKSLASNNLEHMRARDRVLDAYELERKLMEEREKSEHE
ncbi:hypothetical protein V5O48_009264 [Marasmius crinis-equi]|uniref:Uncharacterized protein n=1 Tax=Marasmius crinis-equi TaxID=585013 RepID=A0ABR3FBI5_9AGAR